MGFTSPQEVVDYIKAEEVELVDIRFTDLPGMEQHFTIDAADFTVDAMDCLLYTSDAADE